MTSPLSGDSPPATGATPGKGGAPADPVVLLLGALGWILADTARADRFLGLTGLSAELLRERAGRPETLVAVARFLADHEPDLVACASALGISPTALAQAGRSL